MFQRFFLLILFCFSSFSFAQDTPAKNKAAKQKTVKQEPAKQKTVKQEPEKEKPAKQSSSADNGELSLMELLNDTNRLKNQIKRELAEKEENIQKANVVSKKRVVQIGDLKISVSERKQEGELKPVSSSKKIKKTNQKEDKEIEKKAQKSKQTD